MLLRRIEAPRFERVRTTGRSGTAGVVEDAFFDLEPAGDLADEDACVLSGDRQLVGELERGRHEAAHHAVRIDAWEPLSIRK
jgi:hypothetical protein